jgi:hypothetical protein
VVTIVTKEEGGDPLRLFCCLGRVIEGGGVGLVPERSLRVAFIDGGASVHELSRISVASAAITMLGRWLWMMPWSVRAVGVR